MRALLALAFLLVLAAPARAADPLIAAAGDIACGSVTTNPGPCHQQATSDLLVGRPLTAVLALGDTQYEAGELANFQQFYDPTWGRIKSITRPAVGNHEYGTIDASGYFTYFGAPAGDPRTGYYSYDIGSWHLIALNSNCAKVGGCHRGSLEEKWLKRDLAAHPTSCTLAYWHQPHFTSGRGGNDDGGKNPTGAFWNDLYVAGADVVLGGHDHDYERFAPQTPTDRPDPAFGLREFVVGTGGRSLVEMTGPEPNSEVRNSTTYGVLELTLARRSYTWKFVPVAGQTFTDSGTEPCHGSPNEPLVKLSGPRRKLSSTGTLRFFARCPATCLTRAGATVTIGRRKTIRSLRLTRSLTPQRRHSLRLKFTRKGLRAIRKAFRQHTRLTTDVSASATAGFKSADASLRLRLRP
jgi:acid phosphatase type 7